MGLATAAPLFGINTYSFTQSYSVRACLEQLAQRGFREFELMMYPGHLWPTQIDRAARRDLRAYMESNALSVSSINMPNVDLNIAAASLEMREMTLGVLRQIIELAGAIGAPGVVLGPGKANPLFPMPREQMKAHFFRALDVLLPLARDAGTALFVENMPFAFLPGALELLQAIEEYGDPGVGIVYDVANGHFMREDVGASLRLCARRLRLVHLSDTNQIAYRHDAIGLGTVDFAAAARVMLEIGFKRKPTLEIIGQDAMTSIESSACALEPLTWASQDSAG
jgi:sugar phosphate isomerase/epimerase